MKGHGQFCPVAVACDVFAQRWTPLILRELFAGSTHFNEIKRGLPLISKTLLAQRLRALEDAGVIASVNQGETHRTYSLTPAGMEFGPVIRGLGEWGQRWTARVDRENLDADLLMWNIRRRLATERLPPQATVVRFEFSGLPATYRRFRVFWLLVNQPEIDLCVKDPGSEVDLYVEADMRAFAQVWLGDLSIQAALRSGQLRLTGRRELVRAFPSWLLLSQFAAAPRPATG
jgi:DNA-binding HxlR family transcriptional regulator